jgi:hypothetical protein
LIGKSCDNTKCFWISGSFSTEPLQRFQEKAKIYFVCAIAPASAWRRPHDVITPYDVIIPYDVTYCRCSSTSPTHWWNTVQRFTHSSAAMSIIGFVIGLGDRHLDNILVRCTGWFEFEYNIDFQIKCAFGFLSISFMN